jgi:hypothetical protein
MGLHTQAPGHKTLGKASLVLRLKVPVGGPHRWLCGGRKGCLGINTSNSLQCQDNRKIQCNQMRDEVGIAIADELQ